MRTLSRAWMWLIRSRTVRVTLASFVLLLCWVGWWILPERPLREWRIKGEFGFMTAKINRAGTIALVQTTTRALPASFGVRNWGKFFSWSDNPTSAAFSVNLENGEIVRFKNQYFELNIPREEYQHDFHEEYIEWPLDLERTSTGWVCRDEATNYVIAKKECHDKTVVGWPKYPNDRRWLTVPEDRIDAQEGTFRSFVYKLFNKRTKWVEDTHLCVIDPSNGKLVNEVNAWWVIRWLPDRETFWTASTTYSLTGEPTGVALRLWSVRFARPSWWLWLLTLVIPVGIAWDVRTGIRNQSRGCSTHNNSLCQVNETA